MDVNIASIFHSIGLMGFFTSRAFLPAFLSALTLRLGPEWSWLAETGLFEHAATSPTWFTHNATITVLGILSALEIAADKSPEARQILNNVDKYSKTALAIVTQVGIATTTDIKFVEETLQKSGFVEQFFALVIGAGVYFMASIRSTLMDFISASDEDDDIGVQRLISWAEDVWVTGGVFFLLLYPAVMLALIGFVMGVMFGVRKYAEWAEERSKLPCKQCEEPVYPCAIACQNCATKTDSPKHIGFFGQSKPYPAKDPAHHPHHLVEKKRCPVCATRLPERNPRQVCEACKNELMKDPKFAQEYIDYISAHLPKVLIVSALFSLIPVVGLIPGVIYYRYALVGPFRRYIPWGRSLLLKWLIRILFFILIWFQLIPGLGGVVVPLMALVSYLTYRSAFASMAFADSPASQTADQTEGPAPSQPA